MSEAAVARGGVRRALVLLFAIYLGLLVWLVLWKLHVPFIGRDDMRGIKLVPFVRVGGFGASNPLEVIGNMLVFVPFGIYLAALLPKWKWWKVAALVGGVSIAFEIVQYVTAVGSSDVTDVIANTAGGLVGYGLIAGLGRRMRSRGTAVMTWVLGAVTALAVIAAVTFVATLPRLQMRPHEAGTTISCQCLPTRGAEAPGH